MRLQKISLKIDRKLKILYNNGMEHSSKNYTAAVIGGGASGMAAALFLASAGIGKILLLERNDRVGRKLSATGNGQGNVTNERMGADHYFSDDLEKVGEILRAFGKDDLLRFLTESGGYFTADEEGRVYPASRQAASVTDILRFALSARGVAVKTGEQVKRAEKRKGLFCVETDRGDYRARYLLIAAGGKASPHFGSDGNGYALAQKFGHTVTPLSPALVQLKTEREPIKGLKGIRCDCGVTLKRGGVPLYACRSDVIFTDYGVSGNAIFKTSSRAAEGDTLSLDFLPECGAGELSALLRHKARLCGALASEDLLRCIVNSAAARAVMRSLGIGADIKCGALAGRADEIAARVKDFRLQIAGSMGFDNAQVTKGGIPLAETDGFLMSKREEGLFFAGEILNVDGECGGYNLQWAFSSGVRCARRIAELYHEDR